MSGPVTTKSKEPVQGHRMRNASGLEAFLFGQMRLNAPRLSHATQSTASHQLSASHAPCYVTHVPLTHASPHVIAPCTMTGLEMPRGDLL
jgi:hypothetical protein